MTEQQKRRQDDVRDDAEVGIVRRLRQLDQKQQQNADDGCSYDHCAGEADVVSERVLGISFCDQSFFDRSQD